MEKATLPRSAPRCDVHAHPTMELFDTHCHLNLQDAFPDPRQAIEEAASASVVWLAVVGIDLETCRRALEISERHERVYAIVGWHPNSAASWNAAALSEIRAMLDHPKVVALGEIGLDYHWDFATPEQQRECLLAQLDLASEKDMPVVFHCRNAYDDLLEILESRLPRPYLFHCFSGTDEQARRALALGGLLGFDGPLTYRKSDFLRALFARLPEDRFVLETDSPYLSPEPFRGKPNRPAWITHINLRAASCRGVSPEVCAELSTANAKRFFRLD